MIINRTKWHAWGALLTWSMLLVMLFGLSSCNSKPKELKTDNQIKSEEYLEKIEKDASYKKLPYPNSKYYVYYKQRKAPATPVVRPYQNSKVWVRYTGKTVDGEIFDGKQFYEDVMATDPNYEPKSDPALFTLFEGKSDTGGTIEGFHIGLQYMGVGEKGTIVIPWQLAYGSSQQGIIKAYSALIFEVELVKIEKF